MHTAAGQATTLTDSIRQIASLEEELLLATARITKVVEAKGTITAKLMAEAVEQQQRLDLLTAELQKARTLSAQGEDLMRQYEAQLKFIEQEVGQVRAVACTAEANGERL